jgi:DNA-binding transcriptional ArsR family regulator
LLEQRREQSPRIATGRRRASVATGRRSLRPVLHAGFELVRADAALTRKHLLAYYPPLAERLDTDLLFKALADPGRRKLLDQLHAHDGRTLNQLCEHLDMTRQGVTQHLNLLEAANLVATWRGREKLHFLNPVPLQEIYERWIAKFEKPRLKAIAELKKRLEKAHG